mgnify:FL=1
MRALKILIVGGIAGSSTGLLAFLATLVLSIDGNLELGEFVLVLIIPAIVSILISKTTNSRSWHLFLITYLTLIIPVLGPLFGAPDSSFNIAIGITALGFIGGLAWSSPFAIWAQIRKSTVT